MSTTKSRFHWINDLALVTAGILLCGFALKGLNT